MFKMIKIRKRTRKRTPTIITVEGYILYNEYHTNNLLELTVNLSLENFLQKSMCVDHRNNLIPPDFPSGQLLIFP